MAPSPPKRSACRVVTTAESVRLLLAGQLAALDDLRWTVVSGDDYPDAPSDLRVEVVPMRRELAPSDLRSFVGLVRFFRRHRFCFVQTHTPKASLLGLPAARMAGIPTLYTVHGSLYFKDNTRRRNLAGWCFERWCSTWASRVLLQSAEDAVVLASARICPKEKLHHIGNGIDLDRFREAPLPGREGTRPVVAMVSRLVAEKGCRDYFAVARALRSEADFLHVGPEEKDQRDAIPRRELDSLEASGSVRFMGPVDDVRPHLAAADLVVLPSYREGIPRVAMEAGAMGRPVAGYDIRGMREVVPPETGLLVRRGDVDALTGLVERLVRSPGQRRALGRICRQQVVSACSEQAVVDRLRQIYATLPGSPDVALPDRRRRELVRRHGRAGTSLR